MELITWQNIKPIFHRTSVRKFQSVQTTEERRFALNTSCIRDRTWWCAGRDLTFTRSFPTCVIPPSQGLFPRLLQTSACERFRKPLGLGAILLSPPSLLIVARPPSFSTLPVFAFFCSFGWLEECAFVGYGRHFRRLALASNSSERLQVRLTRLRTGDFGVFMHFSFLGPLLVMRDARGHRTLAAWRTHYLRHRSGDDLHSAENLLTAGEAFVQQCIAKSDGSDGGDDGGGEGDGGDSDGVGCGGGDELFGASERSVQ